MSELAHHSDAQDQVIDVYAIRKKSGYGATQAEFAAKIGVPVKTLRNWEQARRRPTGAALVLLTVLWRNPGAVRDALGLSGTPLA